MAAKYFMAPTSGARPVINQSVTGLTVSPKVVSTEGPDLFGGFQAVGKALAQMRERGEKDSNRDRVVAALKKAGAGDVAIARAYGNPDTTAGMYNADARKRALIEQQRAQELEDEERKRGYTLDDEKRGIENAQVIRRQVHEEGEQRHPYAKITPEGLKALGVPEENIAGIMTLAPKAREDYLMRFNKQGFLKQRAAEAKNMREGQRLMRNFSELQSELSELKPSDVDGSIGTLGNSETWQSIKNAFAGGGSGNEARTAIKQYMGAVRNELMGALKGNPSDRDLAVALQMVEAAMEAESPEVFYNALRRVQGIMADKYDLKPIVRDKDGKIVSGDYEPFSDPHAGKERTVGNKAWPEGTIIEKDGGRYVRQRGRWRYLGKSGGGE